MSGQQQPSPSRAADAEASVTGAQEDESDARAAARDARAAVSTAQAAASDAQAAVRDVQAAVSKAQQRLDKWIDSNLPEGQIYLELNEELTQCEAALKEANAALRRVTPLREEPRAIFSSTTGC
ncbi:hypothetical protein HK405_006646 [Cladochytrium tenue]|nr:hypothetical protein HK405_006646 [Cladochytrium tenue]